MAPIMRCAAVLASLTMSVRAAMVADGPADPAAARTLLTLDLNKDGVVDASEVAAFAKSQGYDAAPTTQEFMGLDANHDGSLDMIELANALSLDMSASTGATSEVAAPAPQETAPSKDQPAQPVQPVQLTALPVEEPIAASPVRLVETSPPQVEAQKAPVPPAEESPAASPVLLAEASPKKVEVEFQKVEPAPQPQKVEVQKVPDAQASPIVLAEASPQKLEVQKEKAPDAQAAASLIAHELSVQAEKEKDARFLDRKAAELRANATALTRQTVQRVLEAGQKAASEKSTQLLQKLTKLEEEAEQAEVQAAALRAKSKAELEQASDFMSIANAALGAPSRGM